MSIEILRELTEAMEIASNGGGVNFYEYAKDGRKALAELEKREPAAWGMENDDGQIYDCITPEEHAREEGQYTVALYRGREPLTEREIELIDGMIEVQLKHATQCDRISNRTMADKQKGWDMERVALLQKLKELNT